MHFIPGCWPNAKVEMATGITQEQGENGCCVYSIGLAGIKGGVVLTGTGTGDWGAGGGGPGGPMYGLTYAGKNCIDICNAKKREKIAERTAKHYRAALSSDEFYLQPSFSVKNFELRGRENSL